MAKYIVQHRRGTAAQWDKTDIIPKEGELVIELDEEKSLHKLKIGDGIHTYAELAYLQAGDEIITQVIAEAKPRVVTVTLAETWTPDQDVEGKYSQVLTLDGITERSKLDLQPTADMLAEFKQLGLVFVTENNGGIITVYSVGNMPLKSYEMQATIIETECNKQDKLVIGIPVGTPTPQPDWDQTDNTKADYIKNKPNLDNYVEKEELNGENSISGSKAYKIIEEFTVALNKQTGRGEATLKIDPSANFEGLEEGQDCTLRVAYVYSNGITIKSINTNDKTITLEGVPLDARCQTKEDDETTHTIWNYLVIQGHPELGNIDVGQNAYAIGYNTIAQGRESFAAGRDNKVVGEYGHVVGYGNVVSYAAHSAGRDNKALGDASHAEGSQNKAFGHNAHAEGRKTQAKGYASHSEGFETQALGDNSHAEGSGTKTGLYNSNGEYISSSGICAHAEGSGTFAPGEASHSEGIGTRTGNYDKNGIYIAYTGPAAHAEGLNTHAKVDASHAEGAYTVAEGYASHAEGGETQALGGYSHAEGQSTKTQGQASHVEGYRNSTDGFACHVEGGNITKCSGEYSHAEGYKTTIDANRAHAEGFETQALGDNSHTEGWKAIAKGETAHAEGNNTLALGANAHAEGINTQALRDNSHTEGNGTKTEGVNAHAEGFGTQANAYASHAEGNGTQAKGDASHTEGNGTKTEGANAHAEGRMTQANGYASHAEGQGTIAAKDNQHVQGKFNKIDKNTEVNKQYAHIVGNGTSDTERSNAHTLDWDGNAWYAGNVEAKDIVIDGKSINNALRELNNFEVSGGGVSQEYVDNAVLPKIEFWEAGREYKKNMLLLVIDGSGNYGDVTVIVKVLKDHTASELWTDDLDNDNLQRVGYLNVKWAESAFFASRDENRNVIHETYAKRDVVKKPTVANEITFTRGTTTIYGELALTGTTIPVSVVDTGEADFESSCIFSIGDTVYPISHESVSMTWAGEDCSDEGYFYPQSNTTYELHAKRLGDMFSIRVGTLVTPHTEEE